MKEVFWTIAGLCLLLPAHAAGVDGGEPGAGSIQEERPRAEASQAVVAELARRSGVEESRVKEMLRDCGPWQQAVNMCALRSFVEADMEMDKVLARQLAALPRCRPALEKKQAAWEKGRDRKCGDIAREESGGGGSMLPGIFYTCQAEATQKRIARLETMNSCAAPR